MAPDTVPEFVTSSPRFTPLLIPDTIKAGLAQVAGVAALFGWIYDAEFTIRNTTVDESDVNPDRFNIVTPIILSGNNRINLGEIQVDRNLQAVDLTLIA